MNILLTNDDGIFAPGLRALLVELRKVGNVTVVAPATEQSAVGHSITLMQPLLVQEVLTSITSVSLGCRRPTSRLCEACHHAVTPHSP